MNGYMELTVPSTVTVPNSGANMVMTCNFCTSAVTASIMWDESTRIMTLGNVFPSTQDYTYKGTSISFSISGWTNPSDTKSAEFTWRSYAVISGTNYLID
jgi:hypothetical protein